MADSILLRGGLLELQSSSHSLGARELGLPENDRLGSTEVLFAISFDKATFFPILGVVRLLGQCLRTARHGVVRLINSSFGSSFGAARSPTRHAHANFSKESFGVSREMFGSGGSPGKQTQASANPFHPRHRTTAHSRGLGLARGYSFGSGMLRTDSRA